MSHLNGARDGGCIVRRRGFHITERARSVSLLETMLIKIKTLTGKELEIDIEQHDKISRIKERVEEKEGIPPAQQRYVWMMLS